MEDLIEKYQNRYIHFCETFNDATLEEALRKFPHEKHFYLGRWTDARRDKDRLEKKLKQVRAKATMGLMKGDDPKSPVLLNERELKGQVEDSEGIKEIMEQIKENEYLVFYLEQLVKQIAFVGNDLKNIIEFKKLQMM